MSVTFAKCPHCRPDARPGRMYGSGVCLFHFQNPPKKGEKPVIVKPSPAEVAAITEVRKPTKKELDAWFKMQLQQRPRCCEFPGCEARLITTGTWQQKANVAHIIPKRHFWSVAL